MIFTSVEDFLKFHKSSLNVSGISRDADIPEGTLRSVVSGNKALPEKHRENLKKVLETLMGGQICE